MSLRNNLGILAAVILTVAGIVRIPGGEEMRAMTRLTTETIMILGLATVLFCTVNRWLGLFVALVAVTALFPVFDRFAHWRRSAVLFGAVWYAAVYFSGSHGAILSAVCIVAIANVLAVMVQADGLDPYQIMTFGLMEAEDNGRLIGLMFNENETGSLLAVCSPAFFRKRWSWGIPIIALAICVTDTTGAMLALAAAICVYLLFTKSPWLIPPLLISVVLYVFFGDGSAVNIGSDASITTGGSFSHRAEWLAIAARIVSDHPWGIGPGHWRLATNQLHAHNDIAQMTTETGILGFGVVFGYVVSLVRRVDVFGAMVLSSILVVSVCYFAWFIPTTALIMATLLAVADKCSKPVTFSPS